MKSLWLGLCMLWLAGPLWAQPSGPPEEPEPTPTPRAENPYSTSPAREAVYLFEEGRRLHREGEVRRAIELYRKALYRDPGRLEYRPYLALALDQNGDYEEAVEQYDLYLKLEPQDARIKLYRAVTLLHQDRLRDLEQVLEELALTQAGNSLYHNLLGLLRLRQGQAQKAAEQFTTALAENPNFVEAQVNLASAYLAMGQSAQAAAQLERALEHNQDLAVARNNLAVLQVRAQRLPEAEATLELISQDARLPEALLNLASVQSRRDQTREALLVTTALVDADPANVGAGILMAQLLYRLGRYPEARKQIDAVLSFGPDELGSYWAYANEISGLVYLAQQQNEAARNDLEKAVLAAPESASAHHNFALVLGLMGEFPEAIAEAQTALKLAGDVAQMWYHLGLLYDLDARPRQALQAYHKFLALAPNDPEVEGLKEHIQDLEAYLKGRPGRPVPQF